MLRLYIVQQSLGLSDEGIENAIYDSQAVWRFVGIDRGCESAHGATTLLKFRRLLERSDWHPVRCLVNNGHRFFRGPDGVC